MSLSQREKLLILIGIVVLVPLMLYRFVFLPINNRQTELERDINRLQSVIEQVSLLGQERNHLKRVTRSRSISLSKRIDAILRQGDLKNRSRIVLEEQPKGGQRLILKLDEINLTELMRLIYDIEHSKPVMMIDNIDIGLSYKNKKLFRVSLALISN